MFKYISKLVLFGLLITLPNIAGFYLDDDDLLYQTGDCSDLKSKHICLENLNCGWCLTNKLNPYTNDYGECISTNFCSINTYPDYCTSININNNCESVNNLISMFTKILVFILYFGSVIISIILLYKLYYIYKNKLYNHKYTI